MADRAEADAKTIMRALLAEGAEARVPLQAAMVQKTAIEAGVYGDAQDAALTYASEMGWIEEGQRVETVVLTEAGYTIARQADA